MRNTQGTLESITQGLYRYAFEGETGWRVDVFIGVQRWGATEIRGKYW